MRAALKTVAILLVIGVSGFVFAPFLAPYVSIIKLWLIGFKQFCHNWPFTSYVIFALMFSLILFLGLPCATAIMLLAGITYEFWEATFLITFCRMLVAAAVFILVRRVVDKEEAPKRKRHQRVLEKKPWLFTKFENHPRIGLFLMRLAPLPDNAVNVTMGSTEMRSAEYMLITMLGMIPVTFILVWIGNELGSVTRLMHFLD